MYVYRKQNTCIMYHYTTVCSTYTSTQYLDNVDLAVPGGDSIEVCVGEFTGEIESSVEKNVT